MDDNPETGAWAGQAERRREAARVPRITIHAFWDSPETAEAIETAAKDRLMARAHVAIRGGGTAGAVEFFQEATTPNLIVVESRSVDDALLDELDRLAEICEAGTKVMVIGHTNDIHLYRELTSRGVTEYLLAPINPVSLIAAISKIYSDQSSAKLGQVYAFIGAKGGVGSSTIAHNVAWTIAHRFDTDVILADMDLPFGTAGLNFNRDTAQGIAEAVQDAGRLDEVLLDRLLTKYDDHLSLLAAPTALDRSYDLEESAFEPMLELAQSNTPFMVLDMPHLWTGWAKKALIAADEIVITAEPDLASLRNAKNLISFLRQARPNDPAPKIVLNQLGVPKRPEIKPGDFAEALQVEPIACLPFEPQLFGASANNGQMIGEESAKAAVAEKFANVAQIITGRNEPKRNRKGLLNAGSLMARLKRKSGSEVSK
jgi:pilus assembly protein CpaE